MPFLFPNHCKMISSPSAQVLVNGKSISSVWIELDTAYPVSEDQFSVCIFVQADSNCKA